MLKDKLSELKSFGDLKTVLKNFISLSIIQGLDMFLPLLTVPYLIRVIGVEKVGLLAFVGAIVGYFGILMNYGFSLTATKDISQSSDDHLKVQEIFNIVFTAKNYLILISFIILILLLFIVPSMMVYWNIYLISFGTIVFLNVTPSWYFQGIQQLKFLTLCNILSKIFFTILVFVFINDEYDFWMVPTFTLLGAFFTAVFTLIYIVKRHQLRIRFANIKEVVAQYDKGKFIFLSQIKISFFSNFNILILGIVLGNSAVGLFSSADKIIKVMSALQIPIVSALFPYFSKLFKDNITQAFLYIKKVAIYGSIVYLILIMIVFIFSNYISSIFFGSELHQIPNIIRILCFIPLFVFLNNLYGTQTLLNLNYDKKFLMNMIIAALINCILLYPLIKIFGIEGAAYSILITEAYLFIGMYLSSQKVKNKINHD